MIWEHLFFPVPVREPGTQKTCWINLLGQTFSADVCNHPKTSVWVLTLLTALHAFRHTEKDNHGGLGANMTLSFSSWTLESLPTLPDWTWWHFKIPLTYPQITQNRGDFYVKVVVGRQIDSQRKKLLWSLSCFLSKLPLTEQNREKGAELSLIGLSLYLYIFNSLWRCSQIICAGYMTKKAETRDRTRLLSFRYLHCLYLKYSFWDPCMTSGRKQTFRTQTFLRKSLGHWHLLTSTWTTVHEKVVWHQTQQNHTLICVCFLTAEGTMGRKKPSQRFSLPYIFQFLPRAVSTRAALANSWCHSFLLHTSAVFFKCFLRNMDFCPGFRLHF